MDTLARGVTAPQSSGSIRPVQAVAAARSAALAAHGRVMREAAPGAGAEAVYVYLSGVLAGYGVHLDGDGARFLRWLAGWDGECTAGVVGLVALVAAAQRARAGASAGVGCGCGAGVVA